MDWTVKKISLYGAELLKSNSSGMVHSTYRNTINLAFGGGLLSLHPEGTPMSPIGLITNIPANCFERFGIEKGARVTINQEVSVLDLADLENPLLSYAQAATTDLSLSGPLSEQKTLFLLRNLRNGILAWGKEGLCTVFLPSGQEPDITAAALARITEAKRSLAAANWEDAARSLCGLIGLGPGLTPSGDDFLCGVLAGAGLTGLKGHPFVQCLSGQIFDGLSRTNDISRAFLRCALEGQYAEVIQLFYTQPVRVILSEIRRIGHTSGVDTLCGILYLFQIWKKLRGDFGIREQEASYFAL